MNTIITPTVGRVVWYWPSQQEIDAKSITVIDPSQPLAATVAHVWHDRMVNLSVVDHAGAQFRRTSVHLVQDDEDRPHTSEGPFAEWMPYQKAQQPQQAKQAGELAQEPQATTEQSAGLVGVDLSLNGSVGMDLAAPGADLIVETKVYNDGASATGTAPLPDESPTQQEATTEAQTAEEPAQA